MRFIAADVPGGGTVYIALDRDSPIVSVGPSADNSCTIVSFAGAAGQEITQSAAAFLAAAGATIVKA